MGWDEVSAVNDEIWEAGQAEIRTHLDEVAKCLMQCVDLLDVAFHHVDVAYNGYDPGYPYPDSQNARAWDYVDVMQDARNNILHRLETWDGVVRD